MGRRCRLSCGGHPSGGPAATAHGTGFCQEETTAVLRGRAEVKETNKDALSSFVIVSLYFHKAWSLSTCLFVMGVSSTVL